MKMNMTITNAAEFKQFCEELFSDVEFEADHGSTSHDVGDDGCYHVTRFGVHAMFYIGQEVSQKQLDKECARIAKAVAKAGL